MVPMHSAASPTALVPMFLTFPPYRTWDGARLLQLGPSQLGFCIWELEHPLITSQIHKLGLDTGRNVY